MSSIRLLAAAAVALAVAVPAAAADDDITFTGCVVRSPGGDRVIADRSLLVWSRGDVVLTGVTTRLGNGAANPVGTSGSPVAHVFYWLDDEDDLAEFAGQRVEITGEVDRDIEKGELEIERKDDFTEIEFEWSGEDVKARVPTAWFGWSSDDKDAEYDIVVRRVDVEDVRRLSDAPCQ